MSTTLSPENSTSTVNDEETVYSRYVLSPTPQKEIWDAYKLQQSVFWTTEEIPLMEDVPVFRTLDPNVKHFIEQTLAFFASSDGLVMDNLSQRFSYETDLREVEIAYAFQASMEGIHAETYTALIETLIPSPARKQELLQAVYTHPSIQQKVQWAERWLNSNDNYLLRVVAFACVEGIFFSGSFCSLDWLKYRQYKLPGLFFSNELIGRDEGLHTSFACIMFRLVKNGLKLKAGATSSIPTEQQIVQIVKEAVEIEIAFAREGLPVALIGMNADTMAVYIQFVADRLLLELGYPPHYHQKNPFPFMNQRSLVTKSNFFEVRVSEYSLASTGQRRNTKRKPTTDDAAAEPDAKVVDLNEIDF